MTNSGTLFNIVSSLNFMCLALEIGGGCCVIIKQSESFADVSFRFISGSGDLTKISSHLKFRAEASLESKFPAIVNIVTSLKFM